jgi:hypothetical protein
MVQKASLLPDQRCPRGWIDENKISQTVTGTRYRRGANGEFSTNIRDIETSRHPQTVGQQPQLLGSGGGTRAYQER